MSKTRWVMWFGSVFSPHTEHSTSVCYHGWQAPGTHAWSPLPVSGPDSLLKAGSQEKPWLPPQTVSHCSLWGKPDALWSAWDVPQAVSSSQQPRHPVGQLAKNWLLPTTTWISLEIDLAPVKPSYGWPTAWTQPPQKPWARGPHSPTLRNWERINIHIFKPQNLKVTCYAVGI